MSGFWWRLFEGLTAIAAVATLPVGLLALIFLGWQAGLVVFVVGWLLLVPVFGILSHTFGPGMTERMTAKFGPGASVPESTSADEESTDVEPDERAPDPLTALRDRYARGEIDEDEFERRVDALLETDPEEPASRAAERISERETERS